MEDWILFDFLCLQTVTSEFISHEWWTLKGKGAYVYAVETYMILIPFQQKSSTPFTYPTHHTPSGETLFFINLILFFFNKNILMMFCCSQCELSSVIIFLLFHLCAYLKHLWRESQRRPAVNQIYLIKSNLEELFLEAWLFWTLSNQKNKLC